MPQTSRLVCPSLPPPEIRRCRTLPAERPQMATIAAKRQRTLQVGTAPQLDTTVLVKAGFEVALERRRRELKTAQREADGDDAEMSSESEASDADAVSRDDHRRRQPARRRVKRFAMDAERAQLEGSSLLEMKSVQPTTLESYRRSLEAFLDVVGGPDALKRADDEVDDLLVRHFTAIFMAGRHPCQGSE